MVDVLTPSQRRLNMSRIRGGNTKPEMALRRGLHRRGFRFVLHRKELPGRPDIVFPRYRKVILVHGCFWHGHDCRFFKSPATRPEFWATKIAANKSRDSFVRSELEKANWRHLTIWECAVRGQKSDATDKVAKQVAKWLLSKSRRGEIRGS